MLLFDSCLSDSGSGLVGSGSGSDSTFAWISMLARIGFPFQNLNTVRHSAGEMPLLVTTDVRKLVAELSDSSRGVGVSVRGSARFCVACPAHSIADICELRKVYY